MQSKFNKVPERPDFPAEEEKILSYWTEIDAFHEQLKLSEGRKPYTFYDGPPFATGLPHYGHIAAGTIKDCMTRYATQTGHYCKRRFGWDCHGLPIEYQIDKQYNIKSSVEREEIGVKEYNRRCREIVMTYSKEWEKIVSRFGRWIDFENDYKTMDCNFMESVWWAFKQIFDKKLVYRGSRIMPFSAACNTVLSNFEAGSNYKDAKDPSIYITFPLLEDPETSLLAWTTTPWTLPSNLACAVNPEFTYVKIQDTENNKKFIFAEFRLKDVLKQTKIKNHKVLEKIPGKDLVGKQYTPLFTYFENMREQKCFSVVDGTFVTKDSGTGVVHCAPGFGEEDYNVCVAKGLVQPGKVVMPMDDDGKFLPSVKEWAGVYFKDADPEIIKNLKDRGRLVAQGTIVHSYPYCWRSQTPLMYRAIDTWFIKVTDIKDQIIKKNEDPTWVPSFVQEKRFKNWLEGARDWCFSRNRYWGNPIPIWASDDMEEIVCIGSIKELQELSGCGEITDLHRESIDHITIPSKMGKGNLKRIPEVFDCWFESGSMPFAQSHYPFSVSDEEFMKGFPANFIAEGLDQTRGWFYTLMVISTAIKDSAPFKNLIVNGIVLAEDGQKMSKSKQNYPDPMAIAKNYGADACRLYLCNSPVVRAESLKFCEKGVLDMVREIFLPWFNAYRFLIQNITRYEAATGKNFVFDEKMKYKVREGGNVMDKWIVSCNQNLIKLVRNEMDHYKLYNVVRPLIAFLEFLTNAYVRFNRSRMKGEDGIEEQVISLNILFDVLHNTNTLMSCITPFITDHMYQNMKNGINPDNKDLHANSIHFLQISECDENLVDAAVERRITRMLSAIENGRLIRERNNISVKTPLSQLVVVDREEEAIKDLIEVQNYIMEELNVLDFKTESNEDEFIQYKCEPDNKLIGGALKKAFDKKLKTKIANLSSAELREYLTNGHLMIGDIKIENGWLKVEKVFNDKYQKHEEYSACSNMTSSVLLRTVIDENLKLMGQAREVVNRIQKLRKSTGISIEDQIEVFFEKPANKASTLSPIVEKHSDKILKAIKMPFLEKASMQHGQVVIDKTSYEAPDNADESIVLYICKPCPHLVEDKVKSDFPQANLDGLHAYLNSFDQKELFEKVTAASGSLKINLDGQDLNLNHRVHFFLNAKDMALA